MAVLSSDCKNGFIASSQNDFTAALSEFKLLAEQGNALGQYLLGDMYSRGAGVPQDGKTAIKWFTSAAELGNAPAQHDLACFFREKLFGRGYKDAIKWYTRAAEQGYVHSQVALGAMHQDGEGVRRDPSIAIKWYTRAAEQGHAPAQWNLARMSMLGKGTPMDFVEARKWLIIAAAGDNGQARSVLETNKIGLSLAEIETAENLACEWMEQY